MNQGYKKILIIGFFILIWIGIIFYGYSEMKTLKDNQQELSFSNSLLKKELAQINDKKVFFTEEIVEDDNTVLVEENIDLDQEIVTEKNDEELIVVEDIPDEIIVISPKEKSTESIDNEVESSEEALGVEENSPEEIEEPDNSQPTDTAGEIEICGAFPCFSDQDFVNIYDSFEMKSGLSVYNKYIYNNKPADDKIRSIAETRGYRKRVFANESSLVWQSERRIQPEVRSSYLDMAEEMRAENITLHFVSGYRSSTHQRNIFKGKMGNVIISKIALGDYDQKINSILEVSSIPGYSRHHSGYTVDFGCGNDYLVYSFATTSCYEWLSANNFENAKRFGFIPSYPEGVAKQGPNPEPWEYVWVGIDSIKK